MKLFCRNLLLLLLPAFVFACAPPPSAAPLPAQGAPQASGLNRILQRGELIVGTEAGMPPFTMKTKTGAIIGLDIDLSKYIASAMNVKLKIVPLPFQRLMDELEAGRVDLVISGMTMTPERNLRVAFVGPYMISGKAFLTKKKTLAAVKNVATLDRAKTRIAVLAGSTSETFVEGALPNATLVKAGTYDQAVDLVLKNRVDAMVADFPICVISVARHPHADLMSAVNMLSYEPLGIAVAPADPLFLNWLNNFLNMMKESGQLEQLKDRWFGQTDWLRELP